MIGHTFGHAGIAVRQDEHWLFYAADAYFYHEEMNVQDPRCTPELRLYQTLMEKDRKSRLWNQRRLRQLVKDRSREIEIFCAHDPIEFERLAQRSIHEPAVRLPFLSSAGQDPSLSPS